MLVQVLAAAMNQCCCKSGEEPSRKPCYHPKKTFFGSYLFVWLFLCSMCQLHDLQSFYTLETTNKPHISTGACRHVAIVDCTPAGSAIHRLTGCFLLWELANVVIKNRQHNRHNNMRVFCFVFTTINTFC